MDEKLYTKRNLYAKVGTGAALIAWRRHQELTKMKRVNCTCKCGTQSSVSRSGPRSFGCCEPNRRN